MVWSRVSFRREAILFIEEGAMFRWAVIFLLIALVAGVFGFTGIAGTAAYFAKVVFGVALLLLVLSLLFGTRAPRV